MGLLMIITSFVFFIAAMAFPRETVVDHQLRPSAVVTEAPNAAVTRPPRCSDGSTLLHTTDCTVGTPVSYCYKPQPPLNCDHGFFPASWHPDHCMEESTCFPLNAAWLTTECSNGAMPYTTRTLYDGTLAGGASTVISAVSCSCPSDQWYSMSAVDGSSGFDTFCMPHSSCPPGMTTSTSTDEYCATASAAVCADLAVETSYCRCAGPEETPIYPDEPGSTAIGCE